MYLSLPVNLKVNFSGVGGWNLYLLWSHRDLSVKLGNASLTVPLGRLLSISKPVSLWL